MNKTNFVEPFRLSVVIPCYNEEETLSRCVQRLLDISDDHLSLEVIIVDDCSTDKSYSIACELEKSHPQITVLRHRKNMGKGAALRSGFAIVKGDFATIQDADLEYDPRDLKKLLKPLLNGDADVVLGSRFLSTGAHRVLYFWHYMGNRLLTFLSNIFTDLNLTDMEACYKIFRRDVIQKIEIQEDKFGFEPEIVAKVAHLRLRIYEMGISYHGRTYEEGKKIGIRDGFRALYCILRYNAHRAPVPVQFLLYLLIGGSAAFINLCVFRVILTSGLSITISTLSAFITAAAVNYFLCILILFRHKARWNSWTEILIYIFIVAAVALIDLGITNLLFTSGVSPMLSKTLATMLVLIFNFYGRRYFVFPEPTSEPWRPQAINSREQVK
jgi:glycosyltransferase involved in cell wall biosynthesis